MDYKVVMDDDWETFREKVSLSRSEGWEPLSRITVHVNTIGDPVYYQSFTKDEA